MSLRRRPLRFRPQQSLHLGELPHRDLLPEDVAVLPLPLSPSFRASLSSSPLLFSGNLNDSSSSSSSLSSPSPSSPLQRSLRHSSSRGEPLSSSSLSSSSSFYSPLSSSSSSLPSSSSSSLSSSSLSSSSLSSSSGDVGSPLRGNKVILQSTPVPLTNEHLRFSALSPVSFVDVDEEDVVNDHNLSQIQTQNQFPSSSSGTNEAETETLIEKASLQDTDSLTPSQLQIYIGDLESQLQKIQQMIERTETFEDPQMLETLLALHDHLLEAIQKYGLQLQGPQTTSSLQSIEGIEREREREEGRGREDQFSHLIDEIQRAQEELSHQLPETIFVEPQNCPVCWNENVVGFQLSPCGHFQCRDCWMKYLSQKVTDGEVLNLICPCPSCWVSVEPEFVENVLEPTLFSKYQQMLLLSRLRVNPNARYCPNPGCNCPTIGNRDDPSFPKLVCSKCSSSFCFECQFSWHEGRTCQEERKEREKNLTWWEKRDKRKGEEATVKYFKKTKTIECKRCGALVQKSSGCNHMKCKCGYEFCWICGEEIVDGGDYPVHYEESSCQQFEYGSESSIGSQLPKPVKYGLVGFGMAVGGVIILGLAVPAAAVALPVYGVYSLVQWSDKRERVKKSRREIEESLKEEERRRRASDVVGKILTERDYFGRMAVCSSFIVEGRVLSIGFGRNRWVLGVVRAVESVYVCVEEIFSCFSPSPPPPPSPSVSAPSSSPLSYSSLSSLLLRNGKKARRKEAKEERKEEGVWWFRVDSIRLKRGMDLFQKKKGRMVGWGDVFLNEFVEQEEIEIEEEEEMDYERRRERDCPFTGLKVMMKGASERGSRLRGSLELCGEEEKSENEKEEEREENYGGWKKEKEKEEEIFGSPVPSHALMGTTPLVGWTQSEFQRFRMEKDFYLEEKEKPFSKASMFKIGARLEARHLSSWSMCAVRIAAKRGVFIRIECDDICVHSEPINHWCAVNSQFIFPIGTAERHKLNFWPSQQSSWQGWSNYLIEKSLSPVDKNAFCTNMVVPEIGREKRGEWGERWGEIGEKDCSKFGFFGYSEFPDLYDKIRDALVSKGAL